MRDPEYACFVHLNHIREGPERRGESRAGKSVQPDPALQKEGLDDKSREQKLKELGVLSLGGKT